MKNNWKKAAALLGLGALLLGLTGCAQKKEPIELTVWTYYNGEQLGAFNEAVEAFNATEGKNNNITVSASSLGSVNDLEQNVMDALQGKVGAQKVPDIFSAYADTAYAVDNMGRAADLSPYLTDKDKKEYIQSYLTEGDFKDDGSIMSGWEATIFPAPAGRPKGSSRRASRSLSIRSLSRPSRNTRL